MRHGPLGLSSSNLLSSNSRFSQALIIRESEKTIIQDRTIYEDAYIFAKNLHASGHINDRDYKSYLDIFHSMITFVHPPDLLIYLKADIPSWSISFKSGIGILNSISNWNTCER